MRTAVEHGDPDASRSTNCITRLQMTYNKEKLHNKYKFSAGACNTLGVGARRMKYHLVVCFLALCISGCDSSSDSAASPALNPDNSAVEMANLVPKTQIPKPCGKAGLTINGSAATSETYELRSGPSLKSPRLKNKKASEIFDETHYHVVDNSTTLRIICQDKDWSEVQIVEPSWLNDVRGWVPNKIIREIEKDEEGHRVFIAADFLWDDSTLPYKSAIVSAVNKISRENSRCLSIDATSVARSGSKSKIGKPVFYVTCNTNSAAFNVWFEPADVKQGRIFTATQNIGQKDAVTTCEQAAVGAATHPSTVEFSTITDLSFHPSTSGRSRVLSTFRAKNAFNLELKYQISCLFDGGDLIETLISEAA